MYHDKNVQVDVHITEQRQFIRLKNKPRITKLC